jgi:quinolinate synthase
MKKQGYTVVLTGGKGISRLVFTRTCRLSVAKDAADIMTGGGIVAVVVNSDNEEIYVGTERGLVK